MKSILFLSIWCFSIYFLNYIRPAVFVPFKDYSFSFYNIFSRRMVHICFLNLFFEYPIFVLIYILSFFIVLLIYPFIIILCFLFYIFFIFYILSKIFKKTSFNFNIFLFIEKTPVNFSLCFLYTFFYQPLFTGCSLAYNTIKFLYKRDLSSKNYILSFFEFLKVFVLGYSFFFLSIVKSLSLVFLTSLYDEQLCRKKNKFFIIYRLILVKIYCEHVIVYNYHRSCVLNNKIFFENGINFNPMKKRCYSLIIDSNSNLSMASMGNSFYAYKSRHGFHVVLNIDGNPHTGALATTNPLDGQQTIAVYGSKSTSCLVTNNMYDLVGMSSEYSGLSNVIKNSGLENKAFRESMINTVELVRDLTWNKEVMIQRGGGRSVTTETIENTNYYIEQAKFQKSLSHKTFGDKLVNYKAEAACKIIKDSAFLKKNSNVSEFIVKKSFFRKGSVHIETAIKSDMIEETYSEKNSPLKKTILTPIFKSVKINSSQECEEIWKENSNNILKNNNEPLMLAKTEEEIQNINEESKKEYSGDEETTYEV